MSFPVSNCAVIIVTNNSQKFIHKALSCVYEQTLQPETVIIVDTGSEDTSYLLNYHGKKSTKLVIADKGIGFCRGNNIGMTHIPSTCKYVFFLNPDAFLTPNFLDKAIKFMENPVNERCGATTGITLGYDIHQDKPTGMYDSTGVFKNWYGRWYDRGQRLPSATHTFKNEENIPAICGAVFFCRKAALEEVLIQKNEVFDSSFYMYKEDIDLSLRLRAKGWSLVFNPELLCYHCRGWNTDRSKVARKLRMCSARNELKIQLREKSLLPILYSTLKYAAVKILNV